MANLRKEAAGRECQIRIPGVCCHWLETSVLAHYRLAGTCGTGIKPPDTLGSIACYRCHDAVDGRIKTEYSYEELRQFHAEGVMRTNIIWLNEGFMRIK